MSLRQYLGKPARTKHCKDEENQQNDFTTAIFLDNFAGDSTSEDSDDDDFKEDYNTLLQNISENPNDEKAIAQKQLLKVAKSQKIRLSKRKLLSKGGKAAGVYSCLNLFNGTHIICLTNTQILQASYNAGFHD